MEPDEILKPIGDRMLVKRDNSKDTTPSGLLLPDASIEPPREGVVEQVGWPENEQRRHSVKPGDRIMVPRYGGVEVELDENNSYVLILEDDIIGIIRKRGEVDEPAEPVGIPIAPRDIHR